MCEIAVVNNVAPEHTEQIVELSRRLYASNQDGLGLVAVYDRDDHFGYDIYKQVDPDFDVALPAFLDSREDAWRFIIHARLGTSGGEGVKEAHPLMMGTCPECSISHVIHNGVVSGHERHQESLIDEGHHLHTEVDSEVIGHTVGDIPESLDDDDFEQPDGLMGSLNYLLLSPDGIFIRSSGKYEVTDEFQMVCKRRGWNLADGIRTGYFLVHPGGEVEHTEREVSYTSPRTIRGQRSGVNRGYGYGWANRRTTHSADDGAATAEAGDDVEIEVVSHEEADLTDYGGVADPDYYRDDDVVTAEVGGREWALCPNHNVRHPITNTCPACRWDLGDYMMMGWCPEHDIPYFSTSGCPECEYESLVVDQGETVRTLRHQHADD